MKKNKRYIIGGICAVLLIALVTVTAIVYDHYEKEKNREETEEIILQGSGSGSTEDHQSVVAEESAGMPLENSPENTKEDSLPYDDYYGESSYTDQQDMTDPLVTITNMDKFNLGMIGNESTASDETVLKLRSRLSSYASANGINASEATILDFRLTYAANGTDARTEYLVEYNDPGRTNAVLIYYPASLSQIGEYADVAPADDYEMTTVADDDNSGDPDNSSISFGDVTESPVKYQEPEEGQRIAEASYIYEGTPYNPLGNSSETGFTDVTFVSRVLQDAGYLDHQVSTYKELYGAIAKKGDGQIGDIMFFGTDNKIEHVAIYLGGFDMIHCGTQVEKINFETSNYWESHLLYYKRAY